MDRHDRQWGRKGATLSDKTARQQYGLTQDEIYAAIDAGKLQYRPRRDAWEPVAAAAPPGGRGPRQDSAWRALPAGTAGADRAGAGQPRAETAPSSARRPQGKAGRAPIRARRARLATAMTLPAPSAMRVSALLVPFPLGAFVCQRRQQEVQRLHLLVHHACKVICRARQAHPDEQHVLLGVLSASVQPRQHGDRGIGGRTPGAALLPQGDVINVRLEHIQNPSRPASTDTGPLARSARSLAVISSPSSCSFSTTSSVDMISSAPAASSGYRRSFRFQKGLQVQACPSRGPPDRLVRRTGSVSGPRSAPISTAVVSKALARSAGRKSRTASRQVAAGA